MQLKQKMISRSWSQRVMYRTKHKIYKHSNAIHLLGRRYILSASISSYLLSARCNAYHYAKYNISRSSVSVCQSSLPVC